MKVQDYKYDVFLSWTGKDKILKDKIKSLLTEAGLSCYDSEAECKGEFRSDYVYALQYSKVYLMIMTENLKNDPNVSGYGTLTEVRKEVSLALDLESNGILNVLIFNTSPFFCFKSVFRDITDQVGWFFYANTRGFSRIDAIDGINEENSQKLIRDVKSFVQARNENKPILSQQINLGIENISFSECENFSGRDDEIKKITDAFKRGKRAVVLSGMGGMGKTSIAKHFVNLCKNEKSFVCPQIIRIQNSDNDNRSDIMGTVLSSVAFSDLESYRGLSDSEKRQKQEKIFANLPEFVILVIDNFSALTKDEIEIILKKTNCKLILTTRMKINDMNYDEIEQIFVDRIQTDVAHLIFDKISETKTDSETFKNFFENIIEGHTITMHMVATAVKMHKKSLEKMLDELKSTGKWEENVTYKDSNDSVFKASIWKILTGLFDIENFENDENCKAILRSLCLIATGKIACRDICEFLHLENYNELNKLAETNWIEFDETRENVSIHRVLSRIADNVLKPTSDNSQDCIDFIVAQSQNRNNLTYTNLVFVRDSLFFAIELLAKNDGKLNDILWSEYCEICRLINDTGTIKANSNRLAEICRSTEDRNKVIIFADLSVLENSPLKIDVIKSHLLNLRNDTQDYKFILQTLSITSPHITSALKDEVSEILDSALSVAFEREDDFAILHFTMNILMHNLSKDLLAKIKKYLSKHKKTQSGIQIYINLLLETYNLSNGNISSFIADFFSGNIEISYKTIFSKLPSLLNILILIKKSSKLPPTDELYDVFQNLEKLIEKNENDDIIDPLLFYIISKQLYELSLKNNVTYVNSFDILNNLFSIIKIMPKSWQGELQQLATTPLFDAKSFTVQQFLDYRLSFEINYVLKNKEAIEQARKMLAIEKSMHNEQNSNIIDAHIRLASTYILFNDFNNSLQEYRLALRLLRQNAPKSKKILEICNAALSIFINKKWDIKPSILKEWYDLGIAIEERFSRDCAILTLNFLTALSFSSELTDENDVFSMYFDELILNEMTEWTKEKDNIFFGEILKFFINVSITFNERKKFSLAQNILSKVEKLREFARSKTDFVRINITYFYLNGFINLSLNNIEKSNYWFDKAINLGSREKINFFGTSSISMYYRYSNLLKDKNIRRYLDEELTQSNVELFTNCFFGKTKLRISERKLINNLFSVISTDDGFTQNDARDIMSLLLNYGQTLAYNNISGNYNIVYFRKSRSGKKYKLAFVDFLWGEFSKLYSNEWTKSYEKIRNEYWIVFTNQEKRAYVKTNAAHTNEYYEAKQYLIKTKSELNDIFESPKTILVSLSDFLSKDSENMFSDFSDYKNILYSRFYYRFVYLTHEQRKGIIDLGKDLVQSALQTQSDDFDTLNEVVELLLKWNKDADEEY